MPKHEHPGKSKGKGKGKKPKDHSIDKFLAKGWQEVVLAAGETATQEIPIDPVAEDIVLFGQQFDVTGERIDRKIHVSVEETETGAIIETATPAQQDVRLLFKIVEGEEEDEPAPV